MKRIILSHGDKGGSGKSEVAKRTAAALIQAGKTIRVIDGDNKNPSLHTAFKNSGADIHCINVMHSDGIDDLFEAIATSPGDVLLDLPARASELTENRGKTAASEKAFNFSLLLENIAADLIVMFVIDQTRPPLVALREELKALPETAKWVIVRNWREERSFELFDGSKIKINLEAKRAPIIDLIRLDPRVNDVLDNNGLNLLSAQDSEKLSMFQKIKAKAVLRDWSEQLSSAGLIG